MKVNVPIKREQTRQNVWLAAFWVYDSNDPNDPELVKMNKFMEGHPDYIKSPWQMNGSWGVDVLRPETDDEYNARIYREKETLRSLPKIISKTP